MSSKTIAVLGGGSAGFTAARVACRQGAHVLLFMGDNADHASLCINAGCMPSKALFEPIDAMHHAKAHGWLIVQPKKPNEYLAQIVHWKDEEIEKFRAYRQKEIRDLAGDRFEIIGANARFAGEHEIISAGRIFRFDAAIVATGSVTTWPRIPGLDMVRDAIWTSDEILHNTDIPKSLAVIGAGPVGLEFSLRYARLGCEVTLLAQKELLSRYPTKFGERLALIYEKEGVRVLTSRRVARITHDDSGCFEVESDGAEKLSPLRAERVLLATGRHPALAELNLAAVGIAPNRQGRLEIGEDMRVQGSHHIFAAGDVAGKRMVVHHAHIEAGIAAENACSDGGRRWTKRSNIQVIFSDPEFAFAGMKYPAAKEAGHELVTATGESRDVGKLHLAGDDLGFGEFSADARTGKLISAGLLCNDASNLIHLPAYAIDHEHTAHQLEDAEFYHPTKTEIITEIGDKLCRKLGGHPFARAEE
ncbi:MAG: FAD-dependent oxidoreductase [Chthoniobacterales bacterium]|nr:FAD-dependent oxidoreductase [Chthoniobacterales bacterium]